MQSRIDEIRKIAERYDNAEDRARRIFLEEASFAIGGKKNTEFYIKSVVARRFRVPFRAVVFCGSSHLGFSPYKDQEFIPGKSDLDLALISMDAFQATWRALNEATKSFTDFAVFSRFEQPLEVADEVKTMMVKRGVLHLSKMPACPDFDGIRDFLDKLAKPHRSLFGAITLSFYMNEYAYCWKQNSAIETILGKPHAK